MQRESHLDGSSVEVCADKLVGYSGDTGDARSYLSCRTLDETGWDVRSSKVYRGLNNRWVASSAELSRKPSSIQPRETMHDQAPARERSMRRERMQTLPEEESIL